MIQRVCVFLAAVFLLTAANVHAGLIVDQFNTPDDQSLKVTAKNKHDHSVSSASSAIDGWRDVSLQLVSSSGQPSYADVVADPGELFFTQGTGQAITTVTWYGADSSSGAAYALNGEDLTSGGDDQFLLTVADVTGQGIKVSITVYTKDINQNVLSSTSVSLIVTAPGVYSLPYSAFSGSADFSKIDAITLELDGTNRAGSDIAITKLATAAPEPSTLVLAAIGGMAFLGVGRKWRRA